MILGESRQDIGADQTNSKWAKGCAGPVFVRSGNARVVVISYPPSPISPSAVRRRIATPNPKQSADNDRLHKNCIRF
jgi:hypothetical protein